MKETTDDARETFMAQFSDSPTEFTVSEARFIEAFESAENLLTFWNQSTRYTCDRLMSRHSGQFRKRY